jgi:hypothetical protein
MLHMRTKPRLEFLRTTGDATSPPGWGWCRSSTLPAAKPNCWANRLSLVRAERTISLL